MDKKYKLLKHQYDEDDGFNKQDRQRMIAELDDEITKVRTSVDASFSFNIVGVENPRAEQNLLRYYNQLVKLGYNNFKIEGSRLETENKVLDK